MHVYNDKTGEFEKMTKGDVLDAVMEKAKRISELPAQHKRHPMVMPGETKIELFRLGAPLHEILSGEDDDVA